MHRRTLIAIIASMILMVPAGAAWCAAGVEVAVTGGADQSVDKQDAFGMGSRIAPASPAPTSVKEPRADTGRHARTPAKPVTRRHRASTPVVVSKPAVRRSKALAPLSDRASVPVHSVKARIVERHARSSQALKPVSTIPAASVSEVRPAPVPAVPSASHRPDKIRMMEEMETKGKAGPKSEDSTVGAVFSTILKLGVVAGLMYGSLLALKVIAGKKPLVHRSAGKMKLMDTVQLSPNSSVHLVKVDGKTLLIGCATGQVNLLQELQTSSVEEETVEESNGKFAEYLAKYSEGPAQGSPAVRLAGLIRDCTSQLHKYQERLRGTADVKAGEDRRES